MKDGCELLRESTLGTCVQLYMSGCRHRPFMLSHIDGVADAYVTHEVVNIWVARTTGRWRLEWARNFEAQGKGGP